MFEHDDALSDVSHTSDFAADDGGVINLGNIGGDVITNPELDVDLDYVEPEADDPYGMEQPDDEMYDDEAEPPDGHGEPPGEEGLPPGGDDHDTPVDEEQPTGQHEDETPADEGETPDPDGGNDGQPTAPGGSGFPFDQLIDPQVRDIDLPEGFGAGAGDDANELPDRSPAEPWESWVRDMFGGEALESTPGEWAAENLPHWAAEVLDDMTWEEVYEAMQDDIPGAEYTSVFELLKALLGL